jgi:hypothetical protein
MPMGDAMGGTQRRSSNDTTYYSRFNLKNGNNQSLGVTFWAGLLQISIDTRNPEDMYSRFEPVIKINLSSMKARLLEREIDAFIEYIKTAKTIDEKKAFGVNAGLGEKVTFIALHANKDQIPIITIGKFDESGTITETHDMVLSDKEFHYSLNWSDLSSNKLDKNFHSDAELMQLRDLVSNFAHNMDGAIAYSVADIMRYDIKREHNKLDQMMNKMGIEVWNGGGGSYNKGNSFLDNVKPASTTHSIDDIL